MRLDVRRIGSLKKGEEVTGNQIRVKVVKNKLAPPFREAEFDLMFGQGINATAEILDQAVAAKRIEKTGAWYAMDGQKIGQGRDNAIAWLNDHPQVREELLGWLRKGGVQEGRV